MSPSTIINNIFVLKINSIENASAVNIGQNFLAEWTNTDTRNQGFGTNTGDQADFLANRMVVDDKDLIDTPVLHRSSLLLNEEGTT